jgi:hypothetical protein
MASIAIQIAVTADRIAVPPLHKAVLEFSRAASAASTPRPALRLPRPSGREQSSFLLPTAFDFPFDHSLWSHLLAIGAIRSIADSIRTTNLPAP